MEAGVGLALQSRAAGFGSDRRRSALYGSEGRARIGSFRVAEQAAAKAVVRARRSKTVAPLRAKKSSGGHETLHNSVDEALLLKRKSEEVLFYLNGRCIYLVGMMGSGKSTVGKIMSEVLGYSFFDSDKLVEQAVGMPSVAQIFKVHSEAFFRDNESSVLRDLSSMKRLVVATGGGAVIRPVNWKYMKKGLSVWLDVPLDALARRITKVGTASRPLLDQPSGDPYTMAFSKLSMLAEQRGDAYANADVRVSLEEIASKQGHDDVSKLTPTDIAIESLHKIENFVIEHTVDNPVGDSQADSHVRRIQTLCFDVAVVGAPVEQDTPTGDRTNANSEHMLQIPTERVELTEHDDDHTTVASGDEDGCAWSRRRGRRQDAPLSRPAACSCLGIVKTLGEATGMADGRSKPQRARVRAQPH
ncbi:hypothetical protein E2562_013777 [Oryza meyeriana var. granulata]|uniref:shikimate kinase n=1 Tax=Oryza meyeriana var. granulata TaxID=110450 RepID=A0A6G1F894_9ORYZ|nr:hypothetical protein E2562_013777 [Oryza meyeriana var. granulata]